MSPNLCTIAQDTMQDMEIDGVSSGCRSWSDKATRLPHVSKRGTLVGYTDVEEKDSPPQVSSQGPSQPQQLKAENGVAIVTIP